MFSFTDDLQHAYQNYRPQVQAKYKVTEGTIYSKLGKDFKVFKRLIDQVPRYRDLLNDSKSKLTLLVVPDSKIPAPVKAALMKLDVHESGRIIGNHMIQGATPFDLFDRMVVPTFNPLTNLAIVGHSIEVSFRNNVQVIHHLGENMFVNGYVHVIDEPIVG